MKNRLLFGVGIVLSSVVIGLSTAYSEDNNESKNSSKVQSNPVAANFRCERLKEADLVKLKEKLTTHCNLDKPFSFSSTDIGVNGSYTYCCHLK